MEQIKVIEGVEIVKNFLGKHKYRGFNSMEIDIENEIFDVNYVCDVVGGITLVAIEEVVTLENGNQIFLLDSGYEDLVEQLVSVIKTRIEDEDSNH